MLTKAFLTLTRHSPAARKALWRAWYDFLGRRYRAEEWTFMNYGYAPTAKDDPGIRLAREDEPDRYCAQLYHHLASQVPLKGKRVVEVGSGRGGGCSFVHRHFEPKATRGIDFSRQAVAFCRRRHRHPGLSFQVGDAGNLPLRDGVVDVVLNVESSHCYPDRPAFFREAHRVLRPGGHFLYTDFFSEEEEADVRARLAATGFAAVADREITPNVVEALERDHARKEQAMKRLLDKPLAGPFGQFAGLKGSKIHAAFASRELRYVAFVLGKPAG
jgi:ubiquinone/menaquinone biosynthesis C-methylase UbiE